MFGRKKPENAELGAVHAEFYQNCSIQIADLEERTTADSWNGLKSSFREVWNDDAQSEEITQKVALARRFAAEVEGQLAAITNETAGDSLKLLQEIIDHAEHQMQALLVGLVTRQSLKSTRS